MNKTIAALLLLSLAGCGDGGPDAGSENAASAPAGVASIEASSPYLDKLRALSPEHRDLALRRAIHDSGQACKRISSSSETGSYRNMATWTAHCEGGRDWAIFIAPNGDVQVRSCGHVEQLGLPACTAAPQAGSTTSSSSVKR